MVTKSSQPLPPDTNKVVSSLTTDVRKLTGPTCPFGRAMGVGGWGMGCGSSECCTTGRGKLTTTPALVPATR